MTTLKIFGIICSVILCGTLSAQLQLEDLPTNREPGKCYAKSLIPDQYEVWEIAIPVYYGDDQEIIDNYVKSESFEISDKTTAWEKRKSDKNCLDPDSDECFVWCLIEKEPEEVIIKWYLTDTTVTDEYELEYYQKDVLSEKGRYTVWQNVLCPDKLTKELILEIRLALGMTDPDIIDEIDSETKRLLTQFQKNNDLPIGNLDMKTLEHLGIDLW